MSVTDVAKRKFVSNYLLLTLWARTKERPSQMDHLEGQQQGTPGQHSKGCTSGTKYCGRPIANIVVTVFAKVSITKAEYNQSESSQTKSSACGTVNDHVEENFWSEDTSLKLLEASSTIFV